ncbi:hypothetical protein IV203_025850 [Nitzschia inconspicua]|uniref:Uncharacterized protein n=1 Tax=Nitzschia inconspicua TaxID=303405 RepID=A0A9K3K9I6_9STRA|nr:hypothetical protein IV203_017698 [Nitzschia inconspicua]KAG7362184.1 hypothetical protein IV203_025850 [Nitzschia inconspicua]
MKKCNDLLLYRDRRSRSLQDWSKSGGKKLYDRFLRQATTCERDQGSGHRGLSDDKEVNDSSITNGNCTIDESSYDSGDEELDLIVSSWKQNFYYFQREQAKRAAASSEEASTTMETFDADEEDSILMAMLEEDESFYEDNYEEEGFDDNTMYDERTVFSLATHEESDFQEFVLQYEQRRRARPFLERFMEVLGITDEEEDEDVASISEATHQSISPLQCSQTGHCLEQQRRNETQRPIGWEGEQILATEEHLKSLFPNLALKKDEDRARSLCVEQANDEGSIKTRHAET